MLIKTRTGLPQDYWRCTNHQRTAATVRRRNAGLYLFLTTYPGYQILLQNPGIHARQLAEVNDRLTPLPFTLTN